MRAYQTTLHEMDGSKGRKVEEKRWKVNGSVPVSSPDPAVAVVLLYGIFYGWRLYLKRPYKRFLVIYIYESPLLSCTGDDWRNCHRLSGTLSILWQSKFKITWHVFSFEGSYCLNFAYRLL